MNKLAKINKATLEIQDKEILFFWIHVDYEEGCSQGIGGIALDGYDKEKDTRVGTAYGCEMIRRILLELNVNDFSEMEGRHIWVLGKGEGVYFKPLGIQALRGDGGSKAGVVFSDIAKEFYPDINGCDKQTETEKGSYPKPPNRSTNSVFEKRICIRW